MINQMRRDSFKRAKNVKIIIMDVDGTLTDGKVHIGENGELFKSFNCRDGHGISLAKQYGMEVILLTGRKSNILLKRAEELKIPPSNVYQGHINKREAYKEIKQKFNVTDEEVAYIGDDVIDLPIMVQAGFTGAVANAVKEVKQNVCVVSDFNGGDGAVREVIEFIFKAKNLWNDIIKEYMTVEIQEQIKDSLYLVKNKTEPQAQAQAQAQVQVKPQFKSQIIKSPQSPIRTQSTQPTQPPIRSQQPQSPQQPIKTQSSQPQKDENLERLEKIGKRFNNKF